MSATRSARYRLILAQRLRAVEGILAGNASSSDDALVLLARLARAVRANPGGGNVWLLFTAVAGAFPTPVQHEALRRRLELATDDEAAAIVLDCTRPTAVKQGEWTRPLRIVDNGVVADVNFCAKYPHNTGIQRVVRSVMPHLASSVGDELRLVAWTHNNGMMRSLAAIERQRVLDWSGFVGGAAVSDETVGAPELIVPWNCRVFLPEVPEKALCDRLAALAEFSGNRVSILGYDTIPIGSADLTPSLESERFARYLSLVKHVDEVVAISESVANEFRGFASALVAQGATGPFIHSIPLAADVPELPPPAGDDALPLVISVGSHEPRKNQEAVLFAVQTLLDEGLRFRFLFIGGGSNNITIPFDRALAKYRAATGHDVRSVRGMRDTELFALFRDARFTVFASLHEGYGLPVVESIASGTPVITANYGSLGEIAAAGGCLVVDPRNDDSIIAGMRELLVDDAAVARLTAEARALPARTWKHYAADLLANSRLVAS